MPNLSLDHLVTPPFMPPDHGAAQFGGELRRDWPPTSSARKVDLIVTIAGPAALAAKGATSSIANYLSSQTSSMRQLLKMLFSIRVSPLTSGCQQVP